MTRWALACATLCAFAASTAYADSVKPSDFDASRKAQDQAILRRVKGRVSVLEAEPARKPQTAAFTLPFGEFTTEESWLNDPTTGEDVLRGRVAFTPGAACPICKSIRMVQIARVEQKLGHDIDWANGQENRNLMRTARDERGGVVEGYFVDHDAIKCTTGPCSPYFRDSWPNPDESAEGGDGAPASLVDYPFGWTYFERISLETCARCVDTGRFLGCAIWGGTWPTTGDRSLRETSAAPQPSATFLDALRRFDAFYTRP